MSAAKVTSLTKSYGERRAVDNLSFTLKKGRLTAFLGPNGAGKSSTIKMLLGLRHPDQGQIEILGTDPSAQSTKAKIGYAAQEMNFPSHLKVREILNWVRSHYEHREELESLITQFSLENLIERTVGGLSGGERRLVGIACAFAGKPELVVLDEPTTGLDLDVKQQLWDVLGNFRNKGGTILLCTHDLSETQKIADDVLMIEKGKIVFSGPLKDMLLKDSLKVVKFRGKDSSIWIETFVEDSDQYIRNIVKNQPDFQDLQIVQASLEEAFQWMRERAQTKQSENP